MTRGERVIAFIHRFCFTPSGEHVGKALVLDQFQRKFILEVYDNPNGTRRGYLSIGRKNGKTALIACILLAHIAGPEAQQNSQIVSGALSRDQASIVFDLACKMIQLSPELSRLIRIVPSSKRLVGLSKNVEFRALSADGKTAHGLSPILAILDEVGQIRGPKSDFIDAIVTAQGAHKAPILLVISTQAANDADLFSIWLDDVKNNPDKRIVSHVYEAPDECELDDQEAWKAANPALGIFRSFDDLKEQAAMAMRMPSFEATFRNLTLNQRVEVNSPFISANTWNANSGVIDEDAFSECPVYAGLDLSSVNDLTAMVLITFKEKWHVKAYFWTPENGLKDRSNRDKSPYDVWVNQGHIKTTPGASIRYEHVARDILEITAGMNLQMIGFDRWRVDLLKYEFEKLGVSPPMTPVGQGFKDMAPAIDILESKLLNNEILHNQTPVLRMCSYNAKIERDGAGNRKLSKIKSTGRIDGIVALAMAFAVCNLEAEYIGDINDFLFSPN